MAKSTKSPAPSGMNRLYVALGAVALVVIALVAYSSVGGAKGATEPVTTEFDEAEIQNAQGIVMGSDAAPVTLYEFADFECPACAQFATFVHPLIKERLVDTGIVRLVRYDFPLVMVHAHSFFAARAGRCAAEQDHFWEFHDILYGRQPTWAVLSDPSSEFMEYAELAGLETSAFSECLHSDRFADEVTKNLRLGESLGVNGTPTLILNGERVLARDYNELEALVYQAAGMEAPSDSATATTPS